jgi:hypothetical protein
MEILKVTCPKCKGNLKYAGSHPGFRNLILLIIAVILITISIILIKHSYENIFRKPANMDEIYPGSGIACLRDLYNDPVYEWQTKCKGKPGRL